MRDSGVQAVTSSETDPTQTHRLAGAVAKFNRSQEHYNALRAEVDQFFSQEPKPYGYRGEYHADAHEWVARFQVFRPPPLRFGVIFGDSVHNLRSCLDHMIWQVTLLDGGTPNTDTQFPIARVDEAQFERMAKRRVPGLSEKHRAMVKQVQPYHTAATEDCTHFLTVLADLDNIDKHQVINPTVSNMAHDADEILDALVGSYEGEGESPVHSYWLVPRWTPLEDDTPWLRVVWRKDVSPPIDVTLAGHLNLGIAFGEFRLDAGEFLRLADGVRGILNAFLDEFPETEYVD
jgi:hypothetical protein